MNGFTIVFLVVVALSTALTLWLAGRQMRYVRAHRDQVPDAFRARVPLSAHQKAADYTLARARFDMAEQSVGTVLLLVWTLGGGLQVLDQGLRGAGLEGLLLGVCVLTSAVLLMNLLELPLTAWHTFVIEQRFGFNRLTWRLFFEDALRHVVLTLLLGVPLAWTVLWLMQASGALWWLYVWAVWIGFGFLMMWAYPAFIAPFFNRFTPLADETLRTRIVALLHKCGFSSKGVFVMDGSRRSGHGNAYFSGLGNNKRIVFFDTLIDSLDAAEIEAVLAHELGHFRLRHVFKRIASMSALSLAGLALLGWLIDQSWFYQGLGVSTASTHMALLLFMMTAPVFGFLLQPVLAHVSRKHEFEADDYAAAQTDAAALISALVKLYKENASTLTPDPLYSAFHDSHPPAPVRIGHLSGKVRYQPSEAPV